MTEHKQQNEWVIEENKWDKKIGFKIHTTDKETLTVSEYDKEGNLIKETIVDLKDEEVFNG